MSVTPERLAEQRRRAEQLRQDIATLDRASREDLAYAELESQSAALDEEIARLEKQRDERAEIAVRQGGGSVAEALAAMEAAQAAHEAQVDETTDETTDETPVDETPVDKATVDETTPVSAPPSRRPALGAPTSTEGEGSK